MNAAFVGKIENVLDVSASSSDHCTTNYTKFPVGPLQMFDMQGFSNQMKHQKKIGGILKYCIRGKFSPGKDMNNISLLSPKNISILPRKSHKSHKIDVVLFVVNPEGEWPEELAKTVKKISHKENVSIITCATHHDKESLWKYDPRELHMKTFNTKSCVFYIRNYLSDEREIIKEIDSSVIGLTELILMKSKTKQFNK